jgi:hypothetical protein
VRHGDAKLNGLARHQLAVAALLGVAIASMFWILLDVAGAYSHVSTSYGVQNFENRFADLPRAATPQTIFGYVSDNRSDDPSDQAEFYLSQYTMAPAILTTSVNVREVIVNLHSGKPDMQALAARGLTPIRDFGNGIILCRNARMP